MGVNNATVAEYTILEKLPRMALRDVFPGVENAFATYRMETGLRVMSGFASQPFPPLIVRVDDILDLQQQEVEAIARVTWGSALVFAFFTGPGGRLPTMVEYLYAASMFGFRASTIPEAVRDKDSGEVNIFGENEWMVEHESAGVGDIAPICGIRIGEEGSKRTSVRLLTEPQAFRVVIPMSSPVVD